MKYFKNIEILYEKFYIIYLNIVQYQIVMKTLLSQIWIILNQVQILIVVTNYNKINNNKNRTCVVNYSRISDSENYNIVTTNLVNSSIGVNRVNLK